MSSCTEQASTGELAIGVPPIQTTAQTLRYGDIGFRGGRKATARLAEIRLIPGEIRGQWRVSAAWVGRRLGARLAWAAIRQRNSLRRLVVAVPASSRPRSLLPINQRRTCRSDLGREDIFPGDKSAVAVLASLRARSFLPINQRRTCRSDLGREDIFPGNKSAVAVPASSRPRSLLPINQRRTCRRPWSRRHISRQHICCGCTGLFAAKVVPTNQSAPDL